MDLLISVLHNSRWVGDNQNRVKQTADMLNKARIGDHWEVTRSWVFKKMKGLQLIFSRDD